MVSKYKYEYTKEKRDPQIQSYFVEDKTKLFRVKFAKSINGKKEYFEKQAFRNFKEALEWKENEIARRKSATPESTAFVTTGRSTFGEYYAMLYRRKVATGKWRQNTAEKTDLYFRKYLLPTWNDFALEDIKRIEFQNWIVDFQTQNNFSHSTLHNIVSKMSMVMEDASINDLIPKNPIKQIDIGGREMRSNDMTKIEYHRLIKAAEEILTPRDLFIFYLFLHGMRHGEVLALKFGDFNGTQLTIDETIDAQHRVGPTKTKSSERTIVLMDFIVDLIPFILKQAQKQYIRAGKQPSADSLIFVNAKLEAINYGMADYMFDKLEAETKIKAWPHLLRHAFITFAMYADNTNIKDIANYVGHGDTSMTMYYNTGTEVGKANVSTFMNSQITS